MKTMTIVFTALAAGTMAIAANGETPTAISPELLGLIAGALLSWVVDNVPYVKTWFGKLDTLTKRWAMRGMLVLTSLSLIGLTCWPVTASILGKYILLSCSEAGLVNLVEVAFFALVGNQTWFSLSPASSEKK
jgi:hypothetical protein